MKATKTPLSRRDHVVRGTFYLLVAIGMLGLAVYVTRQATWYVMSGDGVLLWAAAAFIATAGWVAALAARDLRRAEIQRRTDTDADPPVHVFGAKAQRRKVVRGELLPGSPVDIRSLASEREMYIWLPSEPGWDGITIAKHAKFINVGFTWNQEEAVTVRLTRDEPEHFDPMQVPAWSPPGGAREIILITYELEIIAHLTVPGGYSDIHYSVKRDTVEPRVVIYLA